tara:strand:+ start:60 stop:167 length:108 start_codon:yes stop_codon:yes gene_type:complete
VVVEVEEIIQMVVAEEELEDLENTNLLLHLIQRVH